MASTNKTTHYELSQYVGSDKPTYLTDYNQDMSRIDAGIYGAKAEADTNASSIGTLSNLTTTAQSDLVSAINEVDGDVATNTANISTNTTNIDANTTNIGVLTNLTTTAKNNLVSAINEVDANSDTNAGKIGNLSNLDTVTKTDLVNAINEIVNKFNFSYKQNLAITSNTAVTVEDPVINSAYNSDGSIGKIYGKFNLAGSGSSGNLNTTITIADTGLRPESDIEILGILYRTYYRDGVLNSNQYSYTISFTLHTNGTVTFTQPIWYNENSAYSFIASLIFANDFGDTPVTPTN